jgi:hypothetical protein
MGRVWVLNTETKGTGAEMVPLEKVLKPRDPAIAPVFVPHTRRPPAATDPPAKAPRKFKVVDVMSRQVLAEDADARAAVDLLKEVRSIVDVRVYVWEPKRASWRMLSLREQRMLWALRDR